MLEKEFNSVNNNSKKFQEALEFSKNVGLNNIDGWINDEYEIDRSKIIEDIKSSNERFISIQGEAGSGKSALCKKFVENQEYVLYARAERFIEENNINDIWNFEIKEVLNYLNDKSLVIFIDALEFIADNKKTKFELLQQLYETVKPYSNVSILTSCRSSDKNAFIKLEANYSIRLFIIPDLTLSELLPIAERYSVIQKMINMGSYSELLKSPFYINLIVSKITDINDIENENQLRDYIWKNIICLKDKAKFLYVKYCDIVDAINKIVFERAKQFIIGVPNEKIDSNILHTLVSEGIVTENKNTVRLKYDIFEDICFEQYFDRKFDECKGKYETFFDEIESLGRCVYRRYQIWVSNKILTKSTREKFLHNLVFSNNMLVKWRKQTEIGLVKSRFSSCFFKEQSYNLIENNLLDEFVNVTNLYTFESGINFSKNGNPNISLRPCGSGRSSLIQLIFENNIFKTKDGYKNSIIKLCTDYAKQRNKEKSVAIDACEILKYYVNNLTELSQNPSYYNLEEEINTLLMPIYQMAEFSKDWIKELWNSAVNNFNTTIVKIYCHKFEGFCMEELKNWEYFNIINQTDIESAFQRMCTYLFCYTYDVRNLDEEPNHPGIETYPVSFNGKRYGFQCKYFANKTKYNQIDKSVNSLLNSVYKNQIDVFVLYCNKKFSICPSFNNIKKKLSDNGIELLTVCDDEILRQISSNKYYVIYRLFFTKHSLHKYNQAAKLTSEKNQTLYINFKTSPHNCKSLINDIMKEIETSFNDHKVTILFDGFDEITDSYARELSIFIDEICHKEIINRIFVTCRSLSLKKHYLVHNIPNIKIYKINPLSLDNKLNYAKSSLSEDDFAVFKKLMDSNKLLSQVDDPLCLKYVIDNISLVETSTDIFDLVKLTLKKNLIISEFEILEPKIEGVFEFISYIAFKIYSDDKNYISIYDLNNILKTKYPKLNYEGINKFANGLKSCGLLIECSDGLTFKHKRVFEYFLIEYIYNKYLQDINILQEVNIFKQEDLFDNLFISKLENNVSAGASLNLVAEYNLFKTYMNENSCFGADKNAIMYSDFFVDALCSFDDQTIIDIIDNNSIIKNYFCYTNNNNTFLDNEYSKRIYPFLYRINSADTLKEYFSDILSKEISLHFEDSVIYYDEIYHKADEYTNHILDNYGESITDHYTFITAFSKFVEFAMSKCKKADRKNIVLKFNAKQLDIFCKVIFFPNLISLLFDEELIKTTLSQIEQLSLNTTNSRVLKLYFDCASEDEIKQLKEEIEITKSNVNTEYNIICAYYKLDLSAFEQLETETVCRFTLELLRNNMSCDEYVDEIFYYFEYVRINNGEYGRQYSISHYVLQFLESRLTNNQICLNCINRFINKHYLNIQLLARLKHSKPDIAKNILSKGTLYKVLNNNLDTNSSVEDKADTYFQISFLYSDLDFEKSLYYFNQGYSESIIRILYSKDASITPMLVDSYISVFDYLSLEDREKYLFEIFDMINWIDSYTYDRGQASSIEALADKVYFESPNITDSYIKWMKSNHYWDVSVAYKILNTMIEHNLNIHYIWEVYDKEVRYYFKNSYDTLKLELNFLLTVYSRCKMYTDSDLYKDIEELLKKNVYKKVEISLTKRQKLIFDLMYEDNNAIAKELQNITDDNIINIDDIDIINIDWECNQEDYWEKLICKLYNSDFDLSSITSHLKENYYPNIYGYYRKNWHSLLYAGLGNRQSYKLFYDLLVENSGYCGFYCLIQAYKNDIEKSVSLYKRYHQFCKLLSRK